MPSIFGSPYFSSGSVPTSLTITRRSLTNCRRLLAERIGGYTLVTTDGTPTDTASIIASDLAGGLDPDSYRQAWVFPTQTAVSPGSSAFKLRRVGNQALNTGTGQLTVTAAFPAIIPSGVDVEIHTILPPTRHDKLPGLLGCINNALAELWTYTRLAVTGVNGAPSYDVSTGNDWLEAGAISELYGPPLASTLNPQAWPGWDPIQNADSVKLGVSPTFNTGDAATMGVFRPADTWIKTAGTWGPQSFGLVNDTDEQLFNPQIVVYVALVHAYHALSTQGEASERAYYLKLEQEQRARVNRWKMHGLTRSTHSMNHGLPSSYGGGGFGFDGKDFSTW